MLGNTDIFEQKRIRIEGFFIPSIHFIIESGLSAVALAKIDENPRWKIAEPLKMNGR